MTITHGYKAPTDDLYQEGHGLRTLTWQSYLKDEKGGVAVEKEVKDTVLSIF